MLKTNLAIVKVEMRETYPIIDHWAEYDSKKCNEKMGSKFERYRPRQKKKGCSPILFQAREYLDDLQDGK